MTTTHHPNPAPTSLEATSDGRNEPAHVSFVAGIVALAGPVIPPGLLLAPLAAIVAIVTGLLGRAHATASSTDHDRATLGLVFGLIALVLWSTAIVLLRHVIADLFTEIRAFS